MKTTLFCPAHRSGIAALAARGPLVLLPVLGRTLLDRCLAGLFDGGYREVRITAVERPELIRLSLRNGEPWGLKADLTPVPEEACDIPAEHLLDRLPGSAGSAFADYHAWFETIRAAFRSRAMVPIGMREVSEGVWVHARAKVDPGANLSAPCWIGERVQVEAGTQIGPGAYIEDGCFIDRGAAVEESWIGPGTYVGAFTELIDSLAWGRTLCKWTTGAVTEVADAFLLGELRPPVRSHGASLSGRVAAVAATIVTLPVAGIAVLAALLRRGPLLEWREAVLPDGSCAPYAEFGSLRSGLRRWPRLLAIARGTFAWFGNPPLSRAAAAELQGECERLWLSVPPGLFSLADSMGCPDARDHEATGHAAYYAACRSRRLNATILGRLFKRAIGGMLATFARRKSRNNEHLRLRPSPSGE